jgi:hypothetical protein
MDHGSPRWVFGAAVIFMAITAGEPRRAARAHSAPTLQRERA